MCYHSSITKSREELEAAFDARFAEPQDYQPIFHGNGFTFLRWPVITAEHPKLIQCYHWGLIPFWCKSREAADEMRVHTLNAVSETVFEKPSFKHCIRQKRCLVLSSGFFEWRTSGKLKYPYFVTLKSRELFAMAGLYDRFTDQQTGEVIDTFTVLTTPANALMEKIHNSKKRMPAILKKDQEHEWLLGELNKTAFYRLITPYDTNDMQAYSISKRITSRSENSNVPEVLAHHHYEALND
jgi:putative SOS response-associated peptidase YedK